MLRASARCLASIVTRPIASARTKTLFATGNVDKLVIGASNTLFDGWVSTDISPRARYYLDATMPWPVLADSLSYIYADNMIEHVTLLGAREALRHAVEALKPGGKIRLTTPDIERTASIYLTPGDLRDKVLERARHDNGTPGVYPVDLLRLVMTQAGHHRGQMWDYQSLSAELQRFTFGLHALIIMVVGKHSFKVGCRRERGSCDACLFVGSSRADCGRG